MKRPDRQNYPNGVFGDISYNDRLERYCSYLENQNKQLRIGGVVKSVCGWCGEKRKVNENNSCKCCQCLDKEQTVL